MAARRCCLCLEPVDESNEADDAEEIMYDFESREPYHLGCRWPGYGQCVVCMGTIAEHANLRWMFSPADNTILRMHRQCHGRRVTG